MNYAELDAGVYWNYKDDLLKRVEELGYWYISEAFIQMYKREKLSHRQIASKFGLTPTTIRLHLKNWGVQSRPRGGYNRRNNGSIHSKNGS